MTIPPMVTCPQCGKRHPYQTSNPHRPFCSERCKLIDLGKWADEQYRVAVQDDPFQDELSGVPIKH